jgi:hypothetical protein
VLAGACIHVYVAPSLLASYHAATALLDVQVEVVGECHQPYLAKVCSE